MEEQNDDEIVSTLVQLTKYTFLYMAEFSITLFLLVTFPDIPVSSSPLPAIKNYLNWKDWLTWPSIWEISYEIRSFPNGRRGRSKLTMHSVYWFMSFRCDSNKLNGNGWSSISNYNNENSRIACIWFLIFFYASCLSQYIFVVSCLWNCCFSWVIKCQSLTTAVRHVHLFLLV